MHFKNLKYKVEVFKSLKLEILEIYFKQLEVYLNYASSILEVYFISKVLMDSIKVCFKHTNLNYLSLSEALEIKISPKVYLKYTSCLEYRRIFEL